jgi:SAM-dependent methyltransferase
MCAYEIKEDYVAQRVALTREASPGDYWTPERIAAAGIYQHHVYRKAAEIAEAEGYSRIADFGCGVGDKLQLMFGHLGPVGFDQPTVGGLVSSRNPDIEFRPVDLESPGDVLGTGESFDLTICADVLEHLLDPDPAMGLIRRATRGVAVFSTPDRDVVRGPGVVRSEKPEHVREWNSGEFVSFVETRGFEVLSHALVPRTDEAPGPGVMCSCQVVVAGVRS